MTRIIEKCPEITFEEARGRAHKLLEIAAGRKRYVIPPVLTDEEEQARGEQVKAYFDARKVGRAAYNPFSSHFWVQRIGTKVARGKVAGLRKGARNSRLNRISL